MIGIVVGAALGFIWPSFAVALQPLADGFIKLIKMLLAPVIFATVVLGIAKMGDVKEVGRIGVRAILYFEVASTLALVIRLVVVNVVKPGAGMNIDAGSIDAGAISGYTRTATSQGGAVKFFLDIIPDTLVGAFTNGAMLQVVLVALLLGIALDQLVILGVLLLTSKGSAGVAGAGFVTLAATPSFIGTVPVAGLVLLLGVDRFMNEARPVVNLIGNGIATTAIARRDNVLDRVQQVIREQRGEIAPAITAAAYTTDAVTTRG